MVSHWSIQTTYWSSCDSTTLLVWGIVAHIIADWFLQNDWMAVNKVKIDSWAGPIHAGLHGFCFFFVFPPLVAAALSFVHMLIDFRVPLDWYRKILGQAKEGNPVAVHVKIWQDQAAHVICIAVAAAYVGVR